MRSLEEIVDALRTIDSVRAFSKKIGAEVNSLDVMRETLVWVIRGNPYELKEESDNEEVKSE